MAFLGFIGQAIEDGLEWVKDNIIKPVTHWIKNSVKHIVKGVVSGLSSIARGVSSVLGSKFVRSVMKFIAKAIAIAVLAYVLFYVGMYLFSYSSVGDFVFKEILRFGFNEILKEIFPVASIPDYLKADIAKQMQFTMYSTGDIYHFLPGGFMFNEIEAGGLFFGYGEKLDKYAYAYGYADSADKDMFMNFVAPFEAYPGGEFFKI